MSVDRRPVHVAIDILELYLADVLPLVCEVRVEEHLAECAWCAARARTLFVSYASRSCDDHALRATPRTDAG